MGDGWYSEDYAFEELKDILNETYDLLYELDSCVKGCNSGCYTYEQLSMYVDKLGDRLKEIAPDIKDCTDAEDR